ncbi:unnamed protein product [Calicophoron daubneyi]|uniref:Uncharacterized protein n=1 Tax=Calicophoron daubneyi TaxID=300641 RepID=A0AAV2T9C5_CALDB
MIFSVARLTVEEIEKMKDKKDKLKSKLFFRKILQLFDRDQHSDESPGNAFGLFQCSICNQLMTAATAAYVPCFPSRRVVTQSGDLVPLHKPLPTTTTGILKDNSFVRRSSSCHGSNFTSFGGVDSLHHDDGFIVRSRNISRTPSSLSTSLPSRVPSTPNLICSSPITAIHNTNESAASGGSETTGDRNLFSVTELLGHWLRELGNWRLVYWKLWSVINMESCSRCGRRFPIIELGDGCFYHPAKPVKLDRGEKNDMMGDGVDSAAHVAARSDGLSTPPTPLALNSRSQPDSSSRPDALCPEFMYPCCGQRLFRFDPFETQTGCHRNEHILVEKFGDEDCVRRHLLQHRDLILSWAPKRSFNPNNAPGLMTVGGFPVPPFEVDYLRSRDELLRKIPSFLMATYLRKTDDDEKADEFFGEYLSKANVADKVTSPVYEIVGGVIADGDNSEPLPTMVHGSMLPSAAGLLSAAMSGHTWDCMKCYRINQDSQRQEDLRRMYKLSEFLYSQRTGTGPCTDETESKELNSGIYARLESQWSSQLRGSNASRLLTIQQMKLMKRLNQLYPGKP